ncbi:tRNA N6-adenosine threonylcarbamoyltransferase [Bienertia sinuspersici]
MSSNSNNQTFDPTSHLYVHPSDGPGSVVFDKLQGSSNYRAWIRDMELSLGAKRKLGFLIGGVKRDESDPVKKSQWDSCNDMIISWNCRSVSNSIKKSIMFMGYSHQIWKHLEQRFAVTNAARKYSLNKQIYETRQNGRAIAGFCTYMRVLWEELESLAIIPPLTKMSIELSPYVHALYKQKEEHKLFQFLSGIDDTYSMQRSHMQHQAILPSVEEAYNMI